MAVEKATAMIKKAYFSNCGIFRSDKRNNFCFKKNERVKNEINIISGNVIDKLRRRSCSSLVLQVV